MSKKTYAPYLVLASIACACMVCVQAAPATETEADIVAEGRRLYLDDCGGCHGEHALGDGPVAAVLTIPPTDLTVLSRGNRGVFPEDYVRRAVDGRDLPSAAHGQVAMPVWGLRYKRTLPGYSEAATQKKLDELVAYLKSIQTE